ncbi:MAG: radical SAM protein [Nitrososphaerota archaeon]
MGDVDVLFLHPSTYVSTSDGEVVRYVAVPMGTFALADLLERNGYSTRIVHVGLKRMLDPNYKVENLIKALEPTLVGIDLHWYCHSYDAIKLADCVKRCTNAKVVLGGMTASFFADEILSSFDCVDYVIVGDAELPMIELIKALMKSTEVSDVPNLVYRKGSAVKRSRRAYLASSEDLDKLTCSDLKLLEDWDLYVRLIHENDVLSPKLKTQGWLMIGRGCSVNCSYCGGANLAHRKIFGRQQPIFRSPEKVAEDLRAFEELGISCAYMDFDPYTNRKFYYKLFELVRKEGIDISSQFLIWSLTDRNFVQDLKKTFNPLYTTLTISPETGSDFVRLKNKGFYYDNQSLLRWLEMLEEEMVPAELYFASGLSGETVEEFNKTMKLGERILRTYNNVVAISCNPLFLEPCSPRFLLPKKYGIRLKFRSFSDFYKTYKYLAEGTVPPSRLGYDTEYLNESQIIELSSKFNEVVGSILEGENLTQHCA